MKYRITQNIEVKVFATKNYVSHEAAPFTAGTFINVEHISGPKYKWMDGSFANFPEGSLELVSDEKI